MNKYNMVVVDVDGTLITSEKQVSEMTKQAIKMIKEKGMLFAIATGRPVVSAMAMIESFDLTSLVDYLICSNGVETYNIESKTSTISHPLTKQDVVDIVNLMRPFQLDYCLYQGNIMYTNKLNPISSVVASRNQLIPKVVSAKYLPINQTNKVVFTVYDHVYDELLAFQQKFKHPKFNCFFTQPDLFEFVDKRVNKAKGIEAILKNHPFTMKEVLAFGDAQNDIEMLQEVGCGVAMENAQQEIKNVADAITLSNDHDGIATYLFNLFDSSNDSN